MARLTRAEALAEAAGKACGAQSKLSRWSDPLSFMICTQDEPGHDGAHTACDGHGHVLARWKSETSLIEVWLPDGSYHLI